MEIIQISENTGSFLIQCIQLYEQMLHDIKLCRQKELDAETTIQCCFDMANNYKAKLVEDASSNVFESQVDEILYFKKLKPLFSAEAEFHTYCYHAELFKKNVKDGDPMEIELFFGRQLQRLERFSRDNQVFVDYMVREKTDKDAEWFTQTKDDARVCLYERQIATYLAIKKYLDYIREEVKRLGISFKNGSSEDDTSVC